MPRLRNSAGPENTEQNHLFCDPTSHVPTVLWVRREGQSEHNSASQLGFEILQGTDSRVISISKHPVKALMLLPKLLATRRQVYYQFGPPMCNLVACFLILAGKNVTAHYLDNIIGGYPRWATRLGFHLPIVFILRHCQLLLVISPAMKDYVVQEFGVKTRVRIKYRTGAHGSVGDPDPIRFLDRVVFIGAINGKTNSEALFEAAARLADAGYSLDVYTESVLPECGSQGRCDSLRFMGPAGADQVIPITQAYAAHLLPFNSDDPSFAFYSLSTPSKLPNVLVAGRPIVYHGPDSFWLYRWLRTRPGLCFRLDDLHDGFAIAGVSYTKDEIRANLGAFERLGDER